MRKFSILAIAVAMVFGLYQGATHAASGPVPNVYQGSTGSNYAVYQDVKKSRFCRFMRASRCRTLNGFMRYLNAGCVNDTDKESKCLVTFCGTNCASFRGCPTPGSQEDMACKAHCRFVNLNNSSAQNRLKMCVPDAYSADDAALKTAGRTYDRAQLRAVRSQQRGSQREGDRLLKDLRLYIKNRDGLFIRMRQFRSMTLERFIMIIDPAVRYTQSMRNVYLALQRSGHSSDTIDKARTLINRSNLIAQRFVNDVKTLAKVVGPLEEAVTQSSADFGTNSRMRRRSSISSMPPAYTPDMNVGETTESAATMSPPPPPPMPGSMRQRPIPAPRRSVSS